MYLCEECLELYLTFPAVQLIARTRASSLSAIAVAIGDSDAKRVAFNVSVLSLHYEWITGIVIIVI